MNHHDLAHFLSLARDKAPGISDPKARFSFILGDCAYVVEQDIEDKAYRGLETVSYRGEPFWSHRYQGLIDPVLQKSKRKGEHIGSLLDICFRQALKEPPRQGFAMTNLFFYPEIGMGSDRLRDGFVFASFAMGDLGRFKDLALRVWYLWNLKMVEDEDRKKNMDPEAYERLAQKKIVSGPRQAVLEGTSVGGLLPGRVFLPVSSAA